MNLLMLTKFYPYGTGEAFIEHEINVLSEFYEKITIIACEVPKKELNMRPIPMNVVVHRIDSTSREKNMLTGLKYLFKYDTTFKVERSVCRGVMQKLFLSYFEEKSQKIFKKIISSGYINQSVSEPYVLYSYWLFTTARVATLISMKHKPIYMFTRAHGYDLYEERHAIKYLPYRKHFLKTFDNIFPCSKNGTKYLKDKYPQYANNVETSILGTIDYGISRGSKDGILRIVSCSRIEPVKRISKIVKALQLLDNKDVSIEWTHIGGGSEYELVRKEAENDLHNIKFIFLGNMKNEDVMKLYVEKTFDVFLNVSSSEGLPISVMEAISFGIPAIATNVGGTSEAVVDGVTGRLLSLDFSDMELACAIEKFIPSDKKNISRESCRKYWEDNYQAVLNYRKLYSSLRKKYDTR